MASFWDAITGSAAEDAAEANRIAAQQAFAQGQNVANQYRTNALGALGTGLEKATGALTTNFGTGIDAYSKALADATAAGRAGIAAYTPLSDLGSKYGAATTAALGALGVGPSTFNINTFRNTPGYQFQTEEANRAAANNASRLGIVGSGNTLAEIARRTQGIADTTYNQNYLQPLLSFVSPELQATAGAAAGTAGANKTLADIFQTGGQQIGGANIALGSGLAGLYGNLAGEAPANVYGNVAGLQGQSVRDLAAGTTAANNLELSGAQNAANFWGNLAGTGIKALTAGLFPGAGAGAGAGR